MDKLRLLLLYTFCSDALKPAEIDELKNTLLTSYPDLCLDSFYYAVSKKVSLKLLTTHLRRWRRPSKRAKDLTASSSGSGPSSQVLHTARPSRGRQTRAQPRRRLHVVGSRRLFLGTA